MAVAVPSAAAAAGAAFSVGAASGFLAPWAAFCSVAEAIFAVNAVIAPAIKIPRFLFFIAFTLHQKNVALLEISQKKICELNSTNTTAGTSDYCQGESHQIDFHSVPEEEFQMDLGLFLPVECIARNGAFV